MSDFYDNLGIDEKKKNHEKIDILLGKVNKMFISIIKLAEYSDDSFQKIYKRMGTIEYKLEYFEKRIEEIERSNKEPEKDNNILKSTLKKPVSAPIAPAPSTTDFTRSTGNLRRDLYNELDEVFKKRGLK